MADTELIVKSKIKAVVPDMNVSSDVPEALNRKVVVLLQEAGERAKANGRRTLRAKDL